MFLDHTATIQLVAGAEVWQEEISPAMQRSYKTVSQPFAPPTAPTTPSDQVSKIGLSILAFNADGTMVATRDDSTPTTVWLWDLTKLAAAIVLIQHSPVKRLSWHPTLPYILLIQCTHDEPIIYLYDTVSTVPSPINFPIQKNSGKLEFKWLHTAMDQKPGLVLGDSHSFLIAWPDGRNPMPDEEQDETDLMNHSEDSLYDILSGRKPSALASMDTTEALVSDVMDESTEFMEDTFVGRRAMNIT
jgi:hypothetical protein